MLRSRVLRHWAKVVGVDVNTLKIPDSVRDILADDPELTRADLRKWVLRECDVPDRAYWLPHRVVNCGTVVRTYYVWVGAAELVESTSNMNTTLVLVIGNGCAEIHRWREGSHVPEVTPAVVEKDRKGTGPNVQTSLEIAQYMSAGQQRHGAMTVNGAEVKKIV